MTCRCSRTSFPTFPGVERPAIDYGRLDDACREQSKETNLQPTEYFVKQQFELFDTTQVRHGRMMVGPAGGAKTCCYCTLQLACTVLQTSGDTESPILAGVVEHLRKIQAVKLLEVVNSYFTYAGVVECLMKTLMVTVQLLEVVNPHFIRVGFAEYLMKSLTVELFGGVDSDFIGAGLALEVGKDMKQGKLLCAILWTNHNISCMWYFIGQNAPNDTGLSWLRVKVSDGADLTYQDAIIWYQNSTAAMAQAGRGGESPD